MLGRLEFVPGGRGRGEPKEVYGLRVMRIQTDPVGWLARRRLERAGRELKRKGVRRILLPRGFADWDWLARMGLHTVDPGPFLRAQAPDLALESLCRRDVAPDRATVSLSGARADGTMLRAAAELCPKVRRLVVDVPRGGEELADTLRREFGIPVLPPGEEAQLELRFQPEGRGNAQTTLELFGRVPDLDGIVPSLSGLGEEGEDLCLLSALWERGRLDPAALKFT